MNEEWQPRETTTHQDHVIAHVLGARVLGHIVLDEALYLLLDIGFVWIIFLDCEMGLMPHPVASGELEVVSNIKDDIKADIDQLLSGDSSNPVDELRRLIRTTVECQITDISFFEQGERRRLLVVGDEANLTIETSLSTAEIKVYEH